MTEEQEKQAIKITIGSLIYNLVKKANIDSETLTPEEWKKVEKEIVATILSPVYPNEEILEEQLSFDSLASTFIFMNKMVEQLSDVLNKNVGEEISSDDDGPEFITN